MMFVPFGRWMSVWICATTIGVGCTKGEVATDVTSSDHLANLEADPRFGLSGGNFESAQLLKLNSAAPLFSYSIEPNGPGDIRSFRPCSREPHLGCAEVATAATLPEHEIIRNRAALILYLRERPGQYWTVFNEPDVDNVPPETFARFYHAYYAILREAFSGDSTQFSMFFPGMGTNAPAWKPWLQEAVAAYRRLYPGETLPVAAWTFHAYPSAGSCAGPGQYEAGVAAAQALVNDFVTTVRSLEGGAFSTTPIWLTEWGWIRNHQDPNDAGTVVDNAAPCVADFIRDFGGWLRTSSGVDKFLYFPQHLAVGSATQPGSGCLYPDGSACRYPASWPDGDYPESAMLDPGFTAFGKVLRQDRLSWPAWSGWLWEGSTLSAPGEQYANVARGIWSSGRTPMQPTDDGYDFSLGDWDHDTFLDLFVIAKRRTGTGTTEVHILSGVSGFRQFLFQSGTALHTIEDDRFEFEVADWNKDGTTDLIAISKFFTGTQTTEVHVLSGASGFRDWLLSTGTALHTTDARFDFSIGDWDRDGTVDLFAIKKSGTSSGTTEIHILSGATVFQTFLLSAPTALHETDASFDFGIRDWDDQVLDVFAIKKSGTGTGYTEVHVLSGASMFRTFSNQTGTSLHQTDGTFDFLVNDWTGDGSPELFGIRKSGAASGSTEVQIIPY